jgi:hypothetical protein
VDEQIQVVLAVLKGELSLAEAARRHGGPLGHVLNDWDASPTVDSSHLPYRQRPFTQS